MNLQRVERLLSAGAYQAGMRRAREHCMRSPVSFIGLDSEFTRRGKIVSWQIATESGATSFQAGAINPKMVLDDAAKLGATAKHVVAFSYYSNAELGFFDIDMADSVILASGGTVNATFTDGDRKLTIFDISKFFPGMPLREAAAIFGLEKLEFKDIDKITAKTARDPKFQAYAVRDAVLAVSIGCALRDQMRARGVNILENPTPASAASRFFRTRYLTESMEPVDPIARKLALRALWGGRAECFRRGFFDCVSVWDLSSAYPRSAISFGVLPRPKDWRHGFGLDFLLSGLGGFAVCEFDFGNANIPCLPVFSSGSVWYPSTGTSWATRDEILCAIDFGARVKVYEASIFMDGVKDATRYFEDRIRERSASRTKSEEHAVKILTNSIFGKWSQVIEGVNPSELIAFARKNGIPPSLLAREQKETLDSIGLTSRVYFGASYCPEWFALVTGRVRAYMARVCQYYDVDLLAVSTDSVIVRGTRRPEPFENFRLDARGPGIVARTNAWLVMGPDCDRIAAHGWYSTRAAERALTEWASGGGETLVYGWDRTSSLWDSGRRGARLGARRTVESTGSLVWDGRRALLEGGFTRPWRAAP